MRLGLMLGYAAGQIELPLELVQEADRQGVYAVWTAEAYGSDAITPLAYIAGHTERIRLGTAVIQLAGRTNDFRKVHRGDADAVALKYLLRVPHGIERTGPGANRAEAVEILSRPNYVGADAAVIAASMTGQFTFDQHDADVGVAGDVSAAKPTPLRPSITTIKAATRSRLLHAAFARLMFISFLLSPVARGRPRPRDIFPPIL